MSQASSSQDLFDLFINMFKGFEEIAEAAQAAASSRGAAEKEELKEQKQDEKFAALQKMLKQQSKMMEDMKQNAADMNSRFDELKKDNDEYKKKLEEFNKKGDQPLSNEDFKDLADTHNEMAKELSEFAKTMTEAEKNSPEVQKMMKDMAKEIKNGANELRGYDPDNPQSLNDLKANPITKEEQEAIKENPGNQKAKENAATAGNFKAQLEEKQPVSAVSDQFNAVNTRLNEYQKFAESFQGKTMGAEDMKRHDDMLKEVANQSKAYIEKAEEKGNLSPEMQKRVELMKDIKEFADQNTLDNTLSGPEKEKVKNQQSATRFAIADDAEKDKQRAAEQQKALNEALNKDEKELAKAMKDPNGMKKHGKAVADYMIHKKIKEEFMDKKGNIDPKHAKDVEKLLNNDQLAAQMMKEPGFQQIMDKLDKNPMAKNNIKEEAKEINKDNPVKKTEQKEKKEEKQKEKEKTEQKDKGKSLGAP